MRIWNDGKWIKGEQAELLVSYGHYIIRGYDIEKRIEAIMQQFNWERAITVEKLAAVGIDISI
jgi:hypothetical protein